MVKCEEHRTRRLEGWILRFSPQGPRSVLPVSHSIRHLTSHKAWRNLASSQVTRSPRTTMCPILRGWASHSYKALGLANAFIPRSPRRDKCAQAMLPQSARGSENRRFGAGRTTSPGCCKEQNLQGWTAVDFAMAGRGSSLLTGSAQGSPNILSLKTSAMNLCKAATVLTRKLIAQ